MIRITVLLLALLAQSSAVLAHRASDAELRVAVESSPLKLQLRIALQDLHMAVDLDDDNDRQIRWREITASSSVIEQYLKQRLLLVVDGEPCALHMNRLLADELVGEAATWIELLGDCSAPRVDLSVDYQILFDRDPDHRGIISFNADAITSSAVIAPGDPPLHWTVASNGSADTFFTYFRSGAHHIRIGVDHILFLLVLLLASVGAGAKQRQTLWPVLSRLMLVVTGFTLAHSFSLAASSLGWIRFPVAWVEVAIAASVLLAALNNIFDWVSEHHARMAFGFGLLHGLGFAAALQAFGLPTDALLLALLAFNLGVEAGQLAIVAVLAPILLLLARTTHYAAMVNWPLSLLISLAAAYWLVERFPWRML